MTFDNNPIYYSITTFLNDDLEQYQEWKQNWKRKFVRKIEDAFLECKGNPKYAYCRRVVNRGYDDLNNSV